MSKQKKIDLVSPQVYIGGQPHEQFDWLRENEPIYKHSLPNGKPFWAVTRYDDIYEIGRNYKDYSSASGIIHENHGCPFSEKKQPPSYKESMMIRKDPPEHTKYRRLVSKDFTPNGMKGWDEKIRGIAKDVVDKVIDKGQCEFVSEVAGEFVDRVTGRLLGLPDDQCSGLYEFTELFHHMPGTMSEKEIKDGFKELSGFITEVSNVKSKSDDGDISCRFLFGKVDGENLTYKDFYLQFMLMVNGGTDTVRNLVSVGLYELLKNPKQLAWLMEDLDARMPRARDELLRFISPLIYFCRTATRDIELDGNAIKKGDHVALYYGAANYDSSKFDEPHSLNLARDSSKHLAFGGGHHVCIGQWLARIEIDEIFKEILLRFKNIKIIGEPTWLGSNYSFGLKSMQITFDK